MQGGLGSAQAETLVKTGSVVVEIFGDIGQLWPSRSTIFIFYPTLTQKLLNLFSTFFSHDVQQLAGYAYSQGDISFRSGMTRAIIAGG